jgi:hypothetical protein
VVDLDSGFELAVSVHTPDRSYPATLVDSVLLAQTNLVLAGS